MWWLQLKIRSRSAFDGILGVLYPLFFATTMFLMYRGGGVHGPALLSAAVGASVMGVWSSTSTTAASSLQQERRQGTLELLVAAPTPFPLLILPVTLSMATIGGYSLVATLLWGRFVFGIGITVQPARSRSSRRRRDDRGGRACWASCWRSARCATGRRGRWASALEMPVWLICGFSCRSSPAARLGAADLVGARPDLGHGSCPGAPRLAGRDRAGRCPANRALCLGLAAVYGVIG